MQLKRSDLPVFFDKKIKQRFAFFSFALQKIINSIQPAGMRLIFIVELMFAFWAGPHGLFLMMFKKYQVYLFNDMIRCKSKKQNGNTGINNPGAQFKFALYVFCKFSI
jgi:hypothetical protein